jgi:4-diphosphocytidyl-2-C-methyl-D-erythritol kinase
MVYFPCAKINLGLNILRKRTDGFHDIETVFYPVKLCDILEIIPDYENSYTSINITGLAVPGNSTDNLCLKAYDIVASRHDIPAVNIFLHKIIPMGAGLGGGSSDGAFTLLALNEMFELGLSELQLLEYASMLGSDCAFFIKNKAAIGKGRGNELSETDLSLIGYYIYLVKPEVHVGTAEAYAGVTPGVPEILSSEIITTPLENWKNKLVNDFESSIFPKHPEIKNIKDALYAMGAVYASMSGSGASVYGIFKTEPSENPEFSKYFNWIGKL